MTGYGKLRFCAWIAALSLATEVLADSGDLIALNVGVSTRHDENLFKRPADGSLGAIESDRSTTTQLNATLNKQISLQRFVVQIGLTDVRYNALEALNSLNQNHSAVWQWQVSPHLTGNVSSSRSQAQTDFADFRGNVQNIRTTDSRRFDGKWLVAGGWSLGVGFSNTKSTNSQTFLEDSSSEQRSVDGTIAYAFASGSSLAIQVTNSRGEQPRAIDPIALTDNAFREIHRDLTLNWPISSKFVLAGKVGTVRRIHNSFSARDFAAHNGSATLNWEATPKTRISIARSRSVESWEEVNSNFSQRDLTSATALWSITPKISFSARIDSTTRSFGGDIPGLLPNNRLDKSMTRSIEFNWTPRNKIRLGASVSDDRRDSTLAGAGYHSRTANISANVEF